MLPGVHAASGNPLLTTQSDVLVTWPRSGRRLMGGDGSGPGAWRVHPRNMKRIGSNRTRPYRNIEAYCIGSISGEHRAERNPSFFTHVTAVTNPTSSKIPCVK